MVFRLTQIKFKKKQKVWFLQPGKEKLPAIIKDIVDDVYYLHVFYDGFWYDDMANINGLEIRIDDISNYLFELRKHLLD